jgi:hypothetical protein
VSKGDPAEALERDDTGNRLRHQREQASRARVEEERIVRIDEKLIERKAAGSRLRNARGQAKNAIGNLVCVGLHWDHFLSLQAVLHPNHSPRHGKWHRSEQNAKAEKKPFAASRAGPVILWNKIAIREVVSADRVTWVDAVEKIRRGGNVHLRLPGAENNVW